MSENSIAHILIEYRCHLYSTPIKNVFEFLCSRTMNDEITATYKISRKIGGLFLVL